MNASWAIRSSDVCSIESDGNSARRMSLIESGLIGCPSSRG
jgi:hypothetical protein